MKTGRFGIWFEVVSLITSSITLFGVLFYSYLGLAYYFVDVFSLVLATVALAAAGLLSIVARRSIALIFICIAAGIGIFYSLSSLFLYSQFYVPVVTEIQSSIDSGEVGSPAWWFVPGIFVYVSLGLAVFALVRSSQQSVDEKVRPSTPKVNGFTVTAIVGGIFVSQVVWYVSFANWDIGIATGVCVGIGLNLVMIWVDSLIAKLAASKGRSWHLFFWLALLVSPAVMAIIAAAISPVSSSNPSSRTSADPADDVVGKIRQISLLRDQGLLTEKEFAAKKTELLGKF